MTDNNESDGVWRTICGRRVFIRKGQSLTEAIRASGKFRKDKDGKLLDPTKKNESKEAKSPSRVKQSGAISGAQSGALDSNSPKDRNRTNAHAKLVYTMARSDKNDVTKIAQVDKVKKADFTLDDIQRIKNHMFYNEYDLANGRQRFDPDFEQAQSWLRLQRGMPLEHDIILLQHESIEEKLMAKGLGYDEAHAKANKTANYEKAIEEYKKNAVSKKKRD